MYINNKNMKYFVFLDIDGVLNQPGITPAIEGSLVLGMDDDKINLLAQIINETKALIILVSSWKIAWFPEPFKNKNLRNGNYMDQKFKEHNLFIYDKTDDYSFDRGRGILEYLNKNHCDNYIVLDDDIFEDYDDEILAHLIKTDTNVGLTKEHVQKSIALLYNKQHK